MKIAPNLARVETASLIGLKPLRVEVEVESLVGTPGLTIIGLPTDSVREARDRIIAALATCGIRLPAKRTILNLAPADIKKTGSSLELAMTVAILKVFGELGERGEKNRKQNSDDEDEKQQKQSSDDGNEKQRKQNSDDEEAMFFGELALDGRVKMIKGCLPLVLAAREMKKRKVYVPEENRPELVCISGIEIILVRDLMSLIKYFRQNQRENDGVRKISKDERERKVDPEMRMGREMDPKTRKEREIELEIKTGREIDPETRVENNIPDMSDICGQALAKRALEIAAAGGHNVLLVGTPGSGKSMMARALISILPPPDEEEIIEISKIYSICGLNTMGLMRERPFRSPHHSISAVGMIGGSAQLKPGEITLAHRGVLFLDEFPEFSRTVLEALRQPLEEGIINIARASGQTSFPARFTLIAAANPCPCGYFGSKKKSCQCTEQMRQNYQKRISGPILDRIDMHWRVGEVEISELTKRETKVKTETSAEIKARVIKARQAQKERLKEIKALTNSELSSQQVLRLCELSRDAERLLQAGAKNMDLSARSYFKIIKIAQTIADLSGEKRIDQGKIAEAIQYR